MPLDLQPYKYEIDEATGIAKLSHVVPSIRYMALGRPDVLFQGGVYYYENGEVVPAEKLAEYGLVLKPKTEKEANEQVMKPPKEIEDIVEEARADTMRQQAVRAAGAVPKKKKGE